MILPPKDDEETMWVSARANRSVKKYSSLKMAEEKLNTALSAPTKAIVTGATGNCGYEVLKKCIEDPRFDSVTAIVRRDLDFQHEKLKVVKIQDFMDFSKVEDQLKDHQACYWCLGISTTQVKSEEEYRKITVDYTLHGAKVLSNLNPNLQFHFVSGQGADETMKSRILFARVKGEAEYKLSQMKELESKLFIWRPGGIEPLRKLENLNLSMKLGVFFVKALRPIFSGMVTNGREIADAMFYTTFNRVSAEKPFEMSQMKKFALENMKTK